MKKLVLIAIMSLVPFTAFALDAMNDSALEKITAQEGVSITFDGVQIDQAAMDTAWIDLDGIDSASNPTTGGYIFLSQSSGNMIRISNTMTIDVATSGATGYAGVPANTTFIAIGLPSVTIGAVERMTTISLGEYTDATFATIPTETSDQLGTLYENTTGNTQISGNIYIYAH